jgi:hypothetical protein
MGIVDDEWETPDDLYTDLTNVYDLEPQLDVCANKNNTKCRYWLENALNDVWLLDGDVKPSCVWCNPPHTKTKEFVKKAFIEWNNFNINILMIIPANSVCTEYAKKYIKGSAEIHPIFGRIRFWQDGYPSKYPSRNSYFVVIWRKRDG